MIQKSLRSSHDKKPQATHDSNIPAKAGRSWSTKNLKQHMIQKPLPRQVVSGIRFHLNYKTPPGVIKYRERHTPESTPAFFEVTSPKGAMLLLCLSVLDHSVEVFTNFAGHTFACSILQLNL